MQVALDRHIAIQLNIRGGKPCIAGTRIAVADVATWHLRLGQSLEQIAGHYDIALAALHAAMTYYYDHQSEIDQTMQEDDAFLQATKEATPSLVQAKIRTITGG